jgi:hypothetical protein
LKRSEKNNLKERKSAKIKNIFGEEVLKEQI